MANSQGAAPDPWVATRALSLGAHHEVMAACCIVGKERTVQGLSGVRCTVRE